MDGQRFDELTRHLATGASRRQVLRALAGGALGGFAAAFPFRRALAAPKGPGTPCATDADCGRNQTCDMATATCVGSKGGRPTADESQTSSVGIAAVCTTDADCAANEACVDGVCTATGGPCVRGSSCTTDATCCGGEVCDLDLLTGTGTCVGAGGPCTNVGGACFDTLDCCGAEECVGGTCVRVTGGCTSGTCAGDADCCGGEVCVNNTCALAARPAGCPEGQVRCSGICVDSQTDVNNCGACGVVCPEGQPCVSGVCVASVPCTSDEDCLGKQLCFDGVCSGCESDEVCAPCESCRPRKGGGAPECLPCDLCNPCDPATGRCVALCPNRCDQCLVDDAGNLSCAELDYGPCYTCDRENPGEGPTPICTGCTRCVEDVEAGTCEAVPGCPVCSICDPATETCVAACSQCEECQVLDVDAATFVCADFCGGCTVCDTATGNCVDPCQASNCETCVIDPVTGAESCATICVEGQQCVQPEPDGLFECVQV